LFDDLKQISPLGKFLGEILAAGLVIYSGYVIHFFPWPIANMLLTFFWLVGITNAINFLDNMDGLASGVSLIAVGVLAYFFWRGGQDALWVLALALAGGILGFLVFNFPPAKIFMGDCGSLFIGFTMAALAVAHQRQASDVFAVMGVPIMLFLLPILDTALVTVTRLMRGQSPAQGGTDHTSHRLVAFGLSERQAVLVLYGVALVSGIASAWLEAFSYGLSLVLIPLLLISLALFTAYLGRLKVVTTVSPPQGNLARFMLSLTHKRRLFEIALDLALVGISYYLAFWTRSGLNMTAAGMKLFQRSWLIVLLSAYLSFFIFRIYRGVWRYVGVDDLLRYARGVLGGVVLAVLVLWVWFPGQYSLDIFLLYAAFLFLSMTASRFTFLALDRLYSRQQAQGERVRVLLVGASDAGELALRWILRNPDLGYAPLGFIDDDELLWGRSIHGVDVLGGSQKLEEILGQQQAQGVIITSPDGLSPDVLEKVSTACQARGVWVRVMRLAFELVE
jgi:UDP-GlcNAc:undecaprenyl-phosphate GlcNAc-1-phosphate transferase